MAEVIRMPKLSDTMIEGVVSEWHKKVGETVKSGDLLAEIETDKATMEFESFNNGTLLYIGIDKGKSALVNDVIAIIGEKGEDINKILDEVKSNTKVDSSVKKTEEVKSFDKTIENKSDIKSSKTEIPTVKTSVVVNNTFNNTTNNFEGIKISPLAKKLANEKGIDINKVNGTGEGNRIIKRDIENFRSGNRSNYIDIERYSEEKVTQMRKTIARRLAESKFTAPHFYLTMSIDMDNLINVRESINKDISPKKISFNDFVIKACAIALKENPKVNASWLDDTIRYNQHVHIGVAVAVEEGLLVPVVRFADGKTLTQISKEVKDYAVNAKNKKLQPSDWEGNTFTISNLGMYGIDEFTAIINPPDAVILAIGGINQVPVVKNNQIVPGNIMKVTLSCDHRVVDGAVGSEFLISFKKYMENPILLLGNYNI